MQGATAIKKNPVVEGLYWLGFILFLASVVFSWRAVTSISVGLVILVGLAERLFVPDNHDVSARNPDSS